MKESYFDSIELFINKQRKTPYLTTVGASGGEHERGKSPSLVGGVYGGFPPENFEILDCGRCILSIFCH
jgi:hypothetical protein